MTMPTIAAIRVTPFGVAPIEIMALVGHPFDRLRVSGSGLSLSGRDGAEGDVFAVVSALELDPGGVGVGFVAGLFHGVSERGDG